MERILGIDTGTNSLGWAIVDKEDGMTTLVAKGTNIFAEGVKMDQGKELSKAAERTDHRALRRIYWRRKVRKIRLLTVLMENGLCPLVTKEDLRKWRLNGDYPMSEEFINWQRTEDKENVNPYRFRFICLTQKLDMSDTTQRYILGRALYHLNQRRGFLSNRKDTTQESEGTVSQDIDNLSKSIEASGCNYLGEYFFHLYERGEKIRSHYTSRKDHYMKEFLAICEMQELDESLVGKLRKAIFFQRPLKSQKGLVGKCTFEKNKSRCPVSHPLFEEFRMYQFLNSVKVTVSTLYESGERFLTEEEKQKAIPMFLRKSKQKFVFKDIAKAVAGKNNYCGMHDAEQKAYRFNYTLDTSVSGCPVLAGLTDIFGGNWLDAVCEVYTKGEGKSRYEVMNDIWHVLFSFDDNDRLKEFAMARLQLSEEDASKFCKIHIASDYASLSLKAIRKILPFMKNYGLIYSKAVFLANLGEVVPRYIWELKETRDALVENVINVMNNLQNVHDTATLEECVKGYLKDRYNVDDKSLEKLYHPSMIDPYPRQRPNDDGIYQLGSPRISSVKNPMAMHSMFRLRKVVNLLLKNGYIDEDTKVHIEFSRDLNDANKRKAIQRWNKDNENNRNKCREEIKKLYKEHCGKDIEPSDTDILKYQLWEEQNHICVYTGDTICICDFLGENPAYDIEHTIPRSVGGDTTKENLTLCSSKFNRETKKTKKPSDLANHEEILQRIEHWKHNYEELDKRIRSLKRKTAANKEQKDQNIQNRHYLKLQRDYWLGKYKRFTMTEIPEGFSRRQGTDISVISRFARMYLKSVFKQVYIVKGIATSDFRKIWGIQNVYEKKKRDNHVHHCIDAITIACIDKGEYDKLAQYYHDEENHKWYGYDKANFPKPWPTFVEDIKKVQDELLVAHYSKDNMPKQSKRNVRNRDGRILRNSHGEKVQMRGDTARGSLHKDTYYGAIKRDDEIKYVVRKPVSSLSDADIENIVDEAVKEIIKNAILLHGSLKNAVEKGLWMNESKGIKINKVRCFVSKAPIIITSHRDLSRKEYKQNLLAWNDSNYLVAIYIGKNEKGKEDREFEEINLLNAARYYRRSNEREITGDPIVPIKSQKGYPLAYKLSIGTMVLLYDNNPEEIWEMDRTNLQKRLYVINALSLTDGRMMLMHHQEARQATEAKKEMGAYSYDGDLKPVLRITFNRFKALIQGVDFELNELGEIKRLI